MANHGPSYGLSRELARKTEARFILSEAIEVLLWLEGTTGKALPEDPCRMENASQICEAIKDGVSLCLLMNKLGVPTRFHSNPRMPFHMMENISNFLDSSKAYGVPEISAFQTVDLYEGKQPYKVIECLRALAGVALSKNADGIEFPPWVVRFTEARPRAFPECVMRRGEMVIPLQYGTNKCASQRGMKPYGLARQIVYDAESVPERRQS